MPAPTTTSIHRRRGRAIATTALAALVMLTATLVTATGATAAPATELFPCCVDSPILAGSPGSLTVTAYDAEGEVDTGYRGTIHFSSTDPAATLPNDYTFTAGDNGDHDFQASIVFRSEGEHILTVTETADPSITGSQTEIVVVPAEAAELFVSGIQSPIAVGRASDVIVTAYGADGNVVTDYSGTVHFDSTDPDATLPVDYTFTAGDNGTHTFSNGVIFRTPGQQTVTANDVSNEATGSQTGIEVRDRSASSITMNVKKTDEKLTFKGSVAPNHAGLRVTVKLFRKKAGSFVRIGGKSPLLSDPSAYKASFKRPAPGKCKAVAMFAGDDDHLRSKVGRKFRC